MDHQHVIDITQRWIAAMVIGLDLCPFARRVFDAGAIRYVVSDATTEAQLLVDLDRELSLLAAAPIAQIETTLLIHPHVLNDFLDYNDFLDSAEGRIAALGLDGVIQLASFHPHYQFAGTEPDAQENYTNRSPIPMLHLLREESISAVAGDPRELLAIPKRNMATLMALGKERIAAMLRAVQGESSGA